MAFNIWMENSTVMQSCNEILLGNEKEWAIDSHNHMDEC